MLIIGRGVCVVSPDDDGLSLIIWVVVALVGLILLALTAYFGYRIMRSDGACHASPQHTKISAYSFSCWRIPMTRMLYLVSRGGSHGPQWDSMTITTDVSIEGEGPYNFSRVITSSGLCMAGTPASQVRILQSISLFCIRMGLASAWRLVFNDGLDMIPSYMDAEHLAAERPELARFRWCWTRLIGYCMVMIGKEAYHPGVFHGGFLLFFH